MKPAFRSIHAHRLLRVAAATPRASVGDAAANAQATIALAHSAHDQAVDLVVFPEPPMRSTTSTCNPRSRRRRWPRWKR